MLLASLVSGRAHPVASLLRLLLYRPFGGLITCRFSPRCRGSFIANSNSRKLWKVRYAYGTLCKVAVDPLPRTYCVQPLRPPLLSNANETPIPFSVDGVIRDKIKLRK